MKNLYDKDETLGDMQDRIKTLYGASNARNYSNEGIVLRMIRHATRMLKAFRKDNPKEMEGCLMEMFSWSLALANRFDIDIAIEICKRFPNCCPYCMGKPCICAERAPKRGKLPEAVPNHFGNASIIQKMLADIYPNNTLSGAVIHTVEEVGEVSEEIQVWMSRHKTCDHEKFIEELVDIFANLFAVASCLNVQLDVTFTNMYANGCPACKKAVCECCFKDTIRTPISSKL